MAPRTQEKVDNILKQIGGESLRDVVVSGKSIEAHFTSGENLSTHVYEFLQSQGCDFSGIDTVGMLGVNPHTQSSSPKPIHSLPSRKRVNEFPSESSNQGDHNPPPRKKLDELITLCKTEEVTKKASAEFLRSKPSLSSEFYDDCSDYRKAEFNIARLQHKISIQKFIENGESEADYWKSDEAAKNERNVESKLKSTIMFKKMANRLKNSGASDTPDKREFWRMFFKSNLSIDVPAGHLPTTQQGNLREEVIRLTGIAHDQPEGYADYVWCPITAAYHKRTTTVAGHIFPRKYGKDQLAMIFGEEIRNDLDTPKNVLVMLDEVEKSFDDHAWTFVPDVKDRRSKDEMDAWQNSSPKEYQILVLEPKSKWLKQFVGGISYEGTQSAQIKRLGEILYTGKKVEFRPGYNHRPRQRFLYLHYCCAMIKKQRNDQKIPDGLQQTFGEYYWGTLGRHFKANRIAGLSEFVGHEYAGLLGEDPASQKSMTEGGLAVATMMEEMISQPTRNTCEEERERQEQEVIDSRGALGSPPAQEASESAEASGSPPAQDVSESAEASSASAAREALHAVLDKSDKQKDQESKTRSKLLSRLRARTLPSKFEE